MIYKDKKSSCHFDERSEEKSPRDKGAFSGDFSSLLRRSIEMTTKPKYSQSPYSKTAIQG